MCECEVRGRLSVCMCAQCLMTKPLHTSALNSLNSNGASVYVEYILQVDA